MPSTETPAVFRQALLEIDPARRDDWADRVLGLGELPGDGRDLPRGCVPYLPSSVATLQSAVERARVTPRDVFVDVGSGLGRAMMLVHLMTGAGAVGLEIQAGLAEEAQRIAKARRFERVCTLHGDAERLIGYMTHGTVFFFYCPFGSDRLHRVLGALRPLARVRALRLCFKDMPVPRLPWLVQAAAPPGDSMTICTTPDPREWGRSLSA